MIGFIIIIMWIMHYHYLSHSGIHSSVQRSTTAVKDPGGQFLSTPGGQFSSLSSSKGTIATTVTIPSQKPVNTLQRIGKYSRF